MADAFNMDVDTEDIRVDEFKRKRFDFYRRQNAGIFERTEYADAELIHTEEISAKDAPTRRITVRRLSEGVFSVFIEARSSSPVVEGAAFQIECEDKDLDRNIAEILKSLRSFDLHCARRFGAFSTEIANYIRENKSLYALHLYDPFNDEKEAEALNDALVGNDTLKKVYIDCYYPSSRTVMSLAQTFAFNSTLEFVNLTHTCAGRNVLLLFEQHPCASVFRRLRIDWPMDMLSELAMLACTQTHFPTLSLAMTRAFGEIALREFFEAVAENKTLRELSVWVDHDPNEFSSDPDRRPHALEARRPAWLMAGDVEAAERQLVHAFCALKKNRTITKLAMSGLFVMTPAMATSLSELLAANNSLKDVDVIGMEVQPREAETLLRGLRANFTVTGFTVCRNPDGSDIIREMRAILQRNVALEIKAAEVVIAGVTDGEGVDALKRLHSTTGLVEKVQQLTGMNTEEAFEQIQATLAHLSL
ncbi:hypothetical protein HPB50_015785 [Hyalomma asiaticum]|uniref:Uncharacterized protein n=1 Tax=Hyalomma asiaticum TaxID=266040 RepID=A0ACB7RJN3_HYAAI|nr:hypothetical protein HPB50_015785 [Hyalomma asiaticum]